jgi:hypothetical protein
MPTIDLVPWKAIPIVVVLVMLGVAAATSSLRWYHLGLVLAIPAVLISGERGRQFVVDWAPLLVFWLAYDWLRIVQPHVLAYVGVSWPYRLELWAFGWMAGGEVPPHALRNWFAANGSDPLVGTLHVGLEVVYASHVIAYPLLFLCWWWQGLRRREQAARFHLHVWAFTVLNVIGFAGYVMLPSAPPWWVSIHGQTQPTAELLAGLSLAAGIDGAFTASLIATAPDQFAAVPSLHGAYPVLLGLLAGRRRPAWFVAIVGYGALMWFATVALNLHYVIDLVAGAGAAAVAWPLGVLAAGSGEAPSRHHRTRC